MKSKNDTIVNFILLGGLGLETTIGIFSIIFQYLDIRSLLNLKFTSLFKQIADKLKSNEFTQNVNEIIKKHPARILYLLIEKYNIEFREYGEYGYGRYCVKFKRPQYSLLIPFVYACGYGSLDDIKLFMNYFHFHKYITNRDVNGYKDDMTLKKYVNQIFENKGTGRYTPLMYAALNNCFSTCKYLIENCEADLDIRNIYGCNALHYAIFFWRRPLSKKLIIFLINHMSLDSINEKNQKGETILDEIYMSYDDCNVRRILIALLMSKGAIENDFYINKYFLGNGTYDKYWEKREKGMNF